MAFPPVLGTNFQDRRGRRWTVATVIESGFREVLLVPFSGEGRAAAEFRILEEEWDDWEADATALP